LQFPAALAGLFAGTDVDKVLDWYTEDVVYEDVTMGHVSNGLDSVRKLVEFSFTKAPAQYEAVRSVTTDENYVIEWIMHPMELRGVSVGTLREGKISSNHDYWNGAAFKP